MEEQTPYGKEKTNIDLWDKVKQAPEWALKPIKAGRLKGKSDISPQWRLFTLTEQFGPCGVGWKYTIDKVWPEAGSHEQVFAMAQVSLYIKDNGEWSDAIPGIGGSMLVTKEQAGLHSSDEGYKMAVTDALSVACKALGIAADVYLGRWDGSKYQAEPGKEALITAEECADLKALREEVGADGKKFLARFGIKSLDDLPAKQYQNAVKELEKKRR